MMLAVGFYAGSSYSLLTEITIHCTGVDALGFAFGMEMISAGLGFLVAPPIAGESEGEGREGERQRQRG